jgi:hypothetical protein
LILYTRYMDIIFEVQTKSVSKEAGLESVWDKEGMKEKDPSIITQIRKNYWNLDTISKIMGRDGAWSRVLPVANLSILCFY